MWCAVSNSIIFQSFLWPTTIWIMQIKRERERILIYLFAQTIKMNIQAFVSYLLSVVRTVGDLTKASRLWIVFVDLGYIGHCWGFDQISHLSASESISKYWFTITLGQMRAYFLGNTITLKILQVMSCWHGDMKATRRAKAKCQHLPQLGINL